MHSETDKGIIRFNEYVQRRRTLDDLINWILPSGCHSLKWDYNDNQSFYVVNKEEKKTKSA